MEPDHAAKIAEEAAKALGLEKLAPTIYKDVLQPAAKETGRQLVVVAKAVGVALAPLQIAVWGFDQVRDYLLPRLSARFANKPAEEIQKPNPLIAGPVVMGMAFASEAPHLREMYANLLAAAMHKPSASKAHPSFITVLQSLSPDEALILHRISRRYQQGLFEVTSELSTAASTLGRDEKVMERHVDMIWRTFCNSCRIADPELLTTYRINLVRLGVLAEQHEVYSDKARKGRRIGQVTRLALTDYGRLFIDICVREI